jgi:purine-binding chemotaxis protein CheW
MSVSERTGYEAVADVTSLLEHRAQRLRQSAKTETEAAILWVAEFAVGDERFAVPLASLRAAIPLRMVTPVPLSPPEVIGVVRFQGEVLTAFSLASLLGVRGWREDPAVLIVVERGGGRRLALDCEQIPKPTALPLGAVEAARSASTGPYTEVVLEDLKQINLIDVNRLVAKLGKEGKRAD